MNYPKGKLVAVGGAINSNEEEEHALVHYEEGILEQIVALLSQKHNPLIEIITSASLIPDATAADYIDCLKKLGCKSVNHLKITARKEAYQKNCIERVSRCDCIVFTGGDQLRLYALLRNTPIINCIKAKYKEEAFVVAGISAGAAAMGQTMISAGNAGKAYYKGTIELAIGFGFMPDVIIDTHFDKRGRFARLAQAVITHPEAIGIGLGEKTGVMVSKGNDMKAIGSGSVVIIDGAHLLYSNIASVDTGKAISAENLKVHLMSNKDIYDLTERKFRKVLHN